MFKERKKCVNQRNMFFLLVWGSWQLTLNEIFNMFSCFDYIENCSVNVLWKWFGNINLSNCWGLLKIKPEWIWPNEVGLVFQKKKLAVAKPQSSHATAAGGLFLYRLHSEGTQPGRGRSGFGSPFWQGAIRCTLLLGKCCNH